MRNIPELETKKFPENYPDDAVRILKAMSFTHGKGLRILGSMSLRAQQYAGDYDGYEIVDMDVRSDTVALTRLADRFQEMIRDLLGMPNVYIGDIKAGSIEDLRVIDRNTFDAGKSKKKIRDLLKKGLLTKDEAHDALEVLGENDELIARSKLKFHIVRWTPDEVLAGKKDVRNGSIMTLEQAFGCPTIAKMDVIGFVQNNRYTDFSVIYEFRNKDKTLNPDKIDIVKSLKENIVSYERDGNYFKAMKRRFALAKYQGNDKEVLRLTPILNSDLGRLYHIIGDIGTLESLIEEHNAPLKKIRYEIDQFKNRLANVYSLNDYLKDEPHILKEIDAILKKPKSKILKPLVKVGNELEKFLQSNAKKLSGSGNVVIPKKEFVSEHEHLIKLLEEIGTPKAKAEARKQKKELEGGDRTELEKVLLVYRIRLTQMTRLRDLLTRTEDARKQRVILDEMRTLAQEITRLRSILSSEADISGRGLKGRGDLEDALARRPDLKAKYDDKANWGFRQDFFDQLVKGIITREKYESKPHVKPYDEFKNAVVENAVMRSLTDKQGDKKRDKELADIEERNKAYEEYYKEHPEEEPVVCNVNADLELKKDRDVPRGECDRRHRARGDKKAYHPIFTPLLKGTMTIGDWLYDLGEKTGFVPKQLVDFYRGLRSATDPDGQYKSEELRGFLDLAQKVLIKDKKDDEKKDERLLLK